MNIRINRLLSLIALVVTLLVGCDSQVTGGVDIRTREWLQRAPVMNRVDSAVDMSTLEVALRDRINNWLEMGAAIPHVSVVLCRALHRGEVLVGLGLLELALCQFADAECVPSLIECLDSPDRKVRLFSVRVLGALGDERAVDCLGTRLMYQFSPPENSVSSLLYALARLDGVEARLYLSELTSHWDSDISNLAEELLQELPELPQQPTRNQNAVSGGGIF